MRGVLSRFRPHATAEADQKDLEIKARELMRQAREIDHLVKTDPTGAAPMQYWTDAMTYVRRLSAFYH